MVMRPDCLIQRALRSDMHCPPTDLCLLHACRWACSSKTFSWDGAIGCEVTLQLFVNVHGWYTDCSVGETKRKNILIFY